MWSARCLERGTPGAAGGFGKRTGGNADTAPGAYLTTVWRVVRALRAHDERIADYLDQRRAQWWTGRPEAREPGDLLEARSTPLSG